MAFVRLRAVVNLLSVPFGTVCKMCTSFVQLPVTWQPNADGSRMIGHMILHRHTNASLGLKVVGGRPTLTGRLGAFITRVKRGSIADIVGHLKPGIPKKLFSLSTEQYFNVVLFD